MEEMPLLVGSRVQMAKYICGPGRFAKEGNVRGVATKLCDEMVNPFKEHLLIAEA